jgi:excisionase family DNA binding protein
MRARTPDSRKEAAVTDQQSTEHPKLLLTVPEAAARLGIGRTLMYQLISIGAVASVQVGRLRRIRPADLESYAASLAPVIATDPVAA